MQQTSSRLCHKIKWHNCKWQDKGTICVPVSCRSWWRRGGRGGVRRGWAGSPSVSWVCWSPLPSTREELPAAPGWLHRTAPCTAQPTLGSFAPLQEFWWWPGMEGYLRWNTCWVKCHTELCKTEEDGYLVVSSNTCCKMSHWISKTDVNRWLLAKLNKLKKKSHIEIRVSLGWMDTCEMKYKLSHIILSHLPSTPVHSNPIKSYLLWVFCSKVVVFVGCVSGHLARHTWHLEEQVS